jgi:hypothetical protein
MELDDVAAKIWINECKGQVEGLVSWNKGEGFPSLGIGHFIWYPEGHSERFKETFPGLIAYIEQSKPVPSWLKGPAPWASKLEMESDARLPELKKFLVETKKLQAEFIVKRLEASSHDLPHFEEVANAPGGLFAMIDYVNFKGEGTSPLEQYEGEGWGLKQALELMEPGPVLPSFVAAAKKILKRRVDNSPPERGEERWLKGWYNRLDSYLN